MLLIADEVVTGFGRLGAMFGSDHYGIEPDLITIAKGLTSAYAPLSGVDRLGARSGRCWSRAPTSSAPIGHGWTYSAHPICAAAGIANLELVDELGLVENARETGAYFLASLRDALARPSDTSARCAARACSPRSNWSRTATTAPLLRSGAEGRAARRRRAAQARRHRARHAARRHSRLRPAALPDAPGGGHRRHGNTRCD